MNPNKRIKNYPRHDSQRGEFAYQLYKRMKQNPDIYLLVGDLGYKMFDPHFEDFPDRCFNVGAAEQAMMGIAVGLAQSGKIPFVYSITPFLIYRPFETIRNYVNHEKAKVVLVGSGKDGDYSHDGFSHHAFEIEKVMNILSEIKTSYISNKEEISKNIDMSIKSAPSFICLRR